MLYFSIQCPEKYCKTVFYGTTENNQDDIYEKLSECICGAKYDLRTLLIWEKNGQLKFPFDKTKDLELVNWEIPVKHSFICSICKEEIKYKNGLVAYYTDRDREKLCISHFDKHMTGLLRCAKCKDVQLKYLIK